MQLPKVPLKRPLTPQQMAPLMQLPRLRGPLKGRHSPLLLWLARSLRRGRRSPLRRRMPRAGQLVRSPRSRALQSVGDPGVQSSAPAPLPHGRLHVDCHASLVHSCILIINRLRLLQRLAREIGHCSHRRLFLSCLPLDQPYYRMSSTWSDIPDYQTTGQNPSLVGNMERLRRIVSMSPIIRVSSGPVNRALFQSTLWPGYAVRLATGRCGALVLVKQHAMQEILRIMMGLPARLWPDCGRPSPQFGAAASSRTDASTPAQSCPRTSSASG